MEMRFLPEYLLLPVLSGILMGSSLLPFPPWALPFCLVPLWLFWIRERSAGKILLGGWLAAIILSLVAHHWMAYPAHYYLGLSRPMSVAFMLAHCAVGQLFLPVAGLSFALLRDRLGLSPRAQLAFLPLVTWICHRHVPTIFPWNFGYPWLFSGQPAIHLAEYVGFEGLAALTLFVNLALLLAWEHRKDRRWAFPLGAAAGLLLLMNGAGWLIWKALPPPDATVRALAVQANVPYKDRMASAKRERVRRKILDRYFRMTLQGLREAGDRPPDFVIWPESAFPEALHAGASSTGYAADLAAFVRSNGVPLVTGGLRYSDTGGDKTNAMFFFDRDGNPAPEPYDKARLLVIGEYLPFSETFPVLREWFPRTGKLAIGPGPGIRRIGGLPLGPQICYEGLYPEFTRELSRQGARIIVNITDDCWFGRRVEPFQHLVMTMARGIEFRLPVLRSTNTGITTVMLADGTFLERSPVHAEWTHLYEIPYRENSEPTFFREYGFRLVPAAAWLAAGILLAAGRREKRGIPGS